MSSTLRPSVCRMTTVLLLVFVVVSVANELPPKPAAHLTPPELVRTPRNASFTPSPQDNSQNDHDKSELQQQEARNIAWTTPLHSSHRGRSRDCNPCDAVPWVPVARALNHDNYNQQQHQQYALGIPAIPLALPMNYGIPVAQLRPPPQQAKAQQNLPQQYGPPQQPPQQYGPPPQQYGPPQKFAPSQQTQPQHHVTPSQSVSASNPIVSEAKTSPAPPQNLQQPDDQPGLPPPPLPERFLSPTYGPPQPPTQHTSSSNTNPTVVKLNPNSSPFQGNFQPLPSLKFGPPFDPKQPLNVNIPPNHQLPVGQFQQPFPHPQSVKQFRGEPLRTPPVFPPRPIAFPQMSNIQLPPIYNYQTFNDGKQTHLHAFLQPPKPQNVVLTISESDESCKKCQEQSKVKDSVSAQAQPVTESVRTSNPQHQPHVQVVKSVPLAEYLASVEYPMQIIQAPILDVPDLNKYFDLGYHNFPQVQHLNENSFRVDQKTSQSIDVPKLQSFVNNVQQNASSSGLDNVNLSDNDNPSKNVPTNHKSNDQNNAQFPKSSTSFQPSQTTVVNPSPSTRPSKIYHISKANASSVFTTPSKTTPTLSQSSVQTTSSGHYVTSKPPASTKLETNPSAPPSTTTLLEPVQSSSQNHQSLATGKPSVLANLRFHDPPSGLNDPLAIRDWSYSRGWGNTPPQPFRPTRGPFTGAKQGKKITQIIVPYSTNKQTVPVVQDPANNIGWTPIPPTNQARKVPTNLNHADQFLTPPRLEQIHQYQQLFPTGAAQLPFSASGADNLGRQPFIPTRNGQPLNLPPQVINHILHLNQQNGGWATGPEGLQQLLASNLQGLLRGEEDSIDIARLQKNIDNWTAEGYKQNQPSVNFIPVTTIPHIFNSKKIPDEYLTVTEPTAPSNSSQSDLYEHFQHNLDSDHEAAASQKHQVKIHPQIHVKDEQTQADDPSLDTIEGLLNSWSLLDTKMSTSTSTTSGPSSTSTSSSSAAPETEAWEKLQVSISPLTHEKVYVVTPVPSVDPPSNNNRQARHLAVGR